MEMIMTVLKLSISRTMTMMTDNSTAGFVVRATGTGAESMQNTPEFVSVDVTPKISNANSFDWPDASAKAG
jgi:hypothetical protein